MLLHIFLHFCNNENLGLLALNLNLLSNEPIFSKLFILFCQRELWILGLFYSKGFLLEAIAICCKEDIHKIWILCEQFTTLTPIFFSSILNEKYAHIYSLHKEPLVTLPHSIDYNKNSNFPHEFDQFSIKRISHSGKASNSFIVYIHSKDDHNLKSYYMPILFGSRNRLNRKYHQMLLYQFNWGSLLEELIGNNGIFCDNI